MFTDKELTYKVLAKELRINDRQILDAAIDEEIKVMEPILDSRQKRFKQSLMRREKSTRA